MKAVKILYGTAAAVILFAMTLIWSPLSNASVNDINYVPKYGPHSIKLDNGKTHYFAFITMIDDKGYDIFNYGEIFNQMEGATYDLKTNTLTLENFRHPDCIVNVHEMGDDFTMKIIGECEIETLEVSGGEHENLGPKGETVYWGGSLNLTGSGKLTINHSSGNEDSVPGLVMWGRGCQPLLKLSKHVSLDVKGFGTGPAIQIIQSSGVYDADKAVTIDGKALHQVYSAYQVNGFQYEGEGNFYNYRVEAPRVIINGDGKTDIDNAPVVLADNYLTYNRKVQGPVIKTVDGRAVTEGTDYTTVYSPVSPKNIGKYTVTIKGTGKYVGTTKASFTIIPDSMENVTVTGLTAKKYTGKAIKQVPVLKVGTVKLLAGTDYKVSYNNNIKVGTATITFTGKGNYCDTITRVFKINKAKNPLVVKARTATVRYSKLKDKNLTLDRKKVINIKKKGQGKMNYRRISGNQKITINKKTGKITVKRGLGKGTYKVKVKVWAGGNASYKASDKKKLTIKIIVK